ncbi:MAG: hypothetical protein PVJ19_10250 [Desulfobacteraceae bacterium]|jgi:phosphoglycolate phosphatase-like HAD superfamily hydrolase
MGTTMDILALDFDGVICDSVGEVAVAAWRGAALLWPDRFRGDAPVEIVQRFRRVRPVMETGYESILLVRLLRDGCSIDKILDDAPCLLSDLMRKESLSKDQLVHLLGKERDAWIDHDLQGWLDMHDFYDGVVEAVNRTDLKVYIITTKEKRFALSLCRAVDLQIPEKRIFGLESGKKKDVLATLSRRYDTACFHFVEDRLETLIQMRGGVEFDLRLYLAAWGYNTVDACDKAEKMSKITVLTQDQFPDFVRMPSNFAT